MEKTVSETQTIGTSASVVSVEKGNANGRRIVFIIQNTSVGGQVVSLGFGSEAVASSGIVVNPGGYWMDSKDSGYEPMQQQVTAIASAAGATIAVFERVV